MTLQFAVVHEHESDFDTATELADRVLCEAFDWVEEVLGETRQWVAVNRQKQRLTWTGIKKSAFKAGVRAHGHFPDGSGFPDASAARRALEYLLLEYGDRIDAVVFIRDQDDQPTRRQGLEQARREHEQSCSKAKIIIGLAVVEREAWVIAGFEPQDASEQGTLDAERQKLGFHPHERSHQLTACKDDTAPRSPKRVLRALTGGHYDRERHCWNSTPLALLRERGTENGLVAFLDEVRTHLAPLIGHVPGRVES
jgi:hypothetical protein